MENVTIYYILTMTQGMAGSEYKLVSLHEAKRVHRQLRFILIQVSQLQRFIPLGWLSPLLEVRCFGGRAPHRRRGARGDAHCASRFATRLRRLMQRNAKLNVASSLLQLQHTVSKRQCCCSTSAACVLSRSICWPAASSGTGNVQPTPYQDDSSALTLLKKEPAYAWLNDVSSVALQQEVRHLDSAFKNLFSGRSRFPRFKRKQAAQSFSLMRNAFTFHDGKLTLAKMKDPLDVRWSRELPGAPSSVTVSRDAAGRHFVSLLCKVEVSELPKSDKATAFDLGLSSFLTFADDRPPVAPPKLLAKLLHRVRRLSRALSRKTKGSKNRSKARERLAGLHARIRDRRSDFLHKLSTGLIRENQAASAETLSIRGMMKSRLARSIGDAAWGELLRQLAYKASWYGRTFWQAPRSLASSKTCKDCGFKLKALALSTRSWVCADCGSMHDRDKNAARNILAAGIRATSTAGRAGA